MSASINTTYQWAINTCNDSNVGYSQSYRNQQTVNGVTYYDCSSFIWYALKAGGFDVVSAYESALWSYSGNAVTTAYLDDWLLALGFVEVSIKGEWKPGDVLWRDGHTEMVYTGGSAKGVTMGAHSDSYALAKQVSINTYTSSASSWARIFRYGGGASTTVIVPEWIKGNYYLSETEMQNNAIIVYDRLTSRGWTINAIAGLLGNMESESTINPGIWQSLKEGNYSGGYGLVQWTPATNYTDWAESNGYAIDNGDRQLQWIDEETVSFGQWIATSAYNFSFAEFKTSTKSVSYLASAFLKNFERAGVEVESERQANAEKWLAYLQSITIEETTYKVKKKKKGYNFIIFVHRKRGK